MKRSFVAFAAFLLLGGNFRCQAQVTLARWTFETSFSSITGTGTTLSGLMPEIGNGTASGVHANSATAWSSPAGNGSSHSFSANTWGVGDYYQFQTSTVGFSGIGISFDQTSSATGPGIFTLAYSTDGNNFTPISTDYAVIVNAAPNTWSAGTPVTASSYGYNLTPIPALNNAASVFFRLINDATTSAGGGTVASGGTDRVDNFAVFSPAPEPSTCALAAIGFFALTALRRRR